MERILITLYGIPNCDSCRNARKWLDENAIEFTFHDIRADGLELIDIHRWAQIAGWEVLLNTRSQTWRKVPQAEREGIDAGRALTLMFEQPTLIKRPILENGDSILVGFSAEKYSSSLAG